MRLPRNISGDDLIKALKKYGYQVTRQSGSHVRLTKTEAGNEFHLTIPKHAPLRIGTLNNILKELSAQLDIDRNTLADRLF